MIPSSNLSTMTDSQVCKWERAESTTYEHPREPVCKRRDLQGPEDGGWKLALSDWPSLVRQKHLYHHILLDLRWATLVSRAGETKALPSVT